MNTTAPQHTPPPATRQKGSATLFVSVMLVVLVTLSSVYALRSVLFEQKDGSNHYWSTQTHEVAQSGIEHAIAWLDLSYVLEIAALAVHKAIGDPVVCIFQAFAVTEKHIKPTGKALAFISDALWVLWISLKSDQVIVRFVKSFSTEGFALFLVEVVQDQMPGFGVFQVGVQHSESLLRQLVESSCGKRQRSVFRDFVGKGSSGI